MSQKITLHAVDISCQHCAMTIQRELGALAGIISVQVDVPQKLIHLEYENEAVLAQAKALLAEIGYPVAA